MADDGVVELRQYTLHAGQRHVLVDLFEREFIEPQDAVGAHVRGTFLDRDDADRFVWLRGFADMPSRQRALAAFYGGPVWQANRQAANATLLDSDNVLLLRPVAGTGGADARPLVKGNAAGIFALTIFYLTDADPAAFRGFFLASILPRLATLGVQPASLFETEAAPNNFPRLPVRERDVVFAWLGRWAGEREHQAFVERWNALSGWRDTVPDSPLPAFMRKPEVLRLIPTNRSALR